MREEPGFISYDDAVRVAQAIARAPRLTHSTLDPAFLDVLADSLEGFDGI